MAGTASSIRLTFTFKDGVVQLVSQDAVDMVALVDPPAREPEQGFWVETRDGADRPLSRRVVSNPLPTHLEVFSDEPGRTIAKVPGAPTEGSFTVVLQSDAAAAFVALFSSEHEAAPSPDSMPEGLAPDKPVRSLRSARGRPSAAREIARFELQR